MSEKTKKGREGEDRAAAFLTAKGFSVRERNYRFGRAEIDLIVQRDNWLVFVEVKLRSSDVFGYPEDFVDQKKINRILEAAVEYQYQVNWQGNVRYDIVSIRDHIRPPEIVHIEDAFY
ncbi:MAG: YraN family protein [Cyclobacteriaceae bacterium]|jgi:putative endonuclease